MKKVQITFGDEDVLILEDLKHASSATSAAQVIREALGFYEWARTQIEDGYIVGAGKKGKLVREVCLNLHRRRKRSS
jgi:hypothetical protein